MKATVIALLFTLATAIAVVQGVRVGHQWAELEREVVELERQVAHRQTMLDDAHRYVEHLQREIICVESDMTAREWMWIMADQFREAGVEVNFQ